MLHVWHNQSIFIFPLARRCNLIYPAVVRRTALKARPVRTATGRFKDKEREDGGFKERDQAVSSVSRL